MVGTEDVVLLGPRVTGWNYKGLGVQTRESGRGGHSLGAEGVGRGLLVTDDLGGAGQDLVSDLQRDMYFQQGVSFTKNGGSQPHLLWTTTWMALETLTPASNPERYGFLKDIGVGGVRTFKSSQGDSI